MVVAYYIGTRPDNTVGDTETYVSFYTDLMQGSSNNFDIGFVVISQWFVFLGLSYISLFVLVPFLLLVSYYRLCLALFGYKSSAPLIIIALFIFYPFFLSLSANVIRQGYAVVIINVGLAAAINNKYKKSLASSFCAILFHKSSIIIFPLLLFKRYIEKISFRKVMVIWMLVSAASYLGVFKNLISYFFGVLSNEMLLIDYSANPTLDYQVGFRVDFWLFSSLSIFFLGALKALGKADQGEGFLFCMISFLSIFHIAMFDIAFNDRFGIYAWVFYPLEAIYLVRIYGFNFVHYSARRLK